MHRAVASSPAFVHTFPLFTSSSQVEVSHCEVMEYSCWENSQSAWPLSSTSIPPSSLSFSSSEPSSSSSFYHASNVDFWHSESLPLNWRDAYWPNCSDSSASVTTYVEDHSVEHQFQSAAGCVDAAAGETYSQYCWEAQYLGLQQGEASDKQYSVGNVVNVNGISLTRHRRHHTRRRPRRRLIP